MDKRVPQPGLLRPLAYQTYRLLFAAQVISDLGDWLDLLALIWLIAYQWHLGVGALAALTLVHLLPQAVVGPFAGVFVDRWPRRTVMVTYDMARALLVLGLVAAPGLAIVLVLVLARSVLSAFFGPARQATIRSTVPVDELLPANGLSRFSVNATKVVGPAAGGLLVASVGPRSAFIVDACSFVLSAALLIRLSECDTRAPVSMAQPRLANAFRAGIAFMLTSRILVVAVGGLMAEMVIVEMNDSLTILVFKGLGMTEVLVGLAIGGSGIGNVLGAIAIGQWGRRAHPLSLVGTGMFVVGGVEAILGSALARGAHGGGAWLPAAVGIGIGFAGIWVPFGYILQSETPPQLMGRVSATADCVTTTCGLAGPPLGAFFATRLGVGPVYAGTGVALCLLGVAIWLLRPQALPVSTRSS